MKSQYRGVSWCPTTKTWKVQLKLGGTVRIIYRAVDEEACAWVADFCRYLVYGFDFRQWHHKSQKPNHAPHVSDKVSRAEIVATLLRLGIAEPDGLPPFLAEYDRLAGLLRPV